MKSQSAPRRLDQSRASVGNLAHALKTPLAVLFRTAEDEALPGAVRVQAQVVATLLFCWMQPVDLLIRILAIRLHLLPMARNFARNRVPTTRMTRL